MQWRNSDKFARLAFTGLAMTPLGAVLVSASEWQPDADRPRLVLASVSFYGVVGCKLYWGASPPVPGSCSPYQASSSSRALSRRRPGGSSQYRDSRGPWGTSRRAM